MSTPKNLRREMQGQADIRKTSLHRKFEKQEGELKHLRVPKEPVSALREFSLWELSEEGHLCRHGAGPHYLRLDI